MFILHSITLLDPCKCPIFDLYHVRFLDVELYPIKLLFLLVGVVRSNKACNFVNLLDICCDCWLGSEVYLSFCAMHEIF